MKEICKEGTYTKWEKSPKQGLTSAEDLPIELPEGRESPTIDHTKITILTYSQSMALEG